MQQQINWHILGYSILANFSERGIIERNIWDLTQNEILHENSVRLLTNFSERNKNACERDILHDKLSERDTHSTT